MSEVPPTGDRPQPQSPPVTPHTTTDGGCRCCNTTSASAVAVATASAFSTASAVAIVRVMVIIAIIIAISVEAIAIAYAFASATAIAIAIAVAIAIAFALALAIAIAIAVALVARFRRMHPHCVVVLDVPPTASKSAPLEPAVVWETIDPSGVSQSITVVASSDNGQTFSPIVFNAGGGTAVNLPLTGSFIWETIAQAAVGRLFLARAIALDAAGNEVCRSQIKAIRVVP